MDNQIKIPQLISRYIPVGFLYPIDRDITWWRSCSDFYYPNVLINLATVDRSDLDKYELNDDVFLLTDSGGFQVISGKTDLDWKTSIDLQVKLRATKIFSFDVPPVKRVAEGQNIFKYHLRDEVRKIIELNFDVALKQSEYLQKTYPEFHKRFCYIFHGNSVEDMDYNIELIEKKIGMSNYPKYFPGGAVYAIKSEDYMLLAMTSFHAKKYFIDKGMYVHFLGAGSLNKMIILVRNKISTFDSSTALRGAISWSTSNPVRCDETFISSKEDYFFDKNFCFCPTCRKIDVKQVLEKNATHLGEFMVKHNLWHMLKMNMFLDGIDKKKYTKVINDVFKPNKKVMESLEFIDFADKNGLEMAMKSKYVHSLKKDETKQKGLDLC